MTEKPSSERKPGGAQDCASARFFMLQRTGKSAKRQQTVRIRPREAPNPEGEIPFRLPLQQMKQHRCRTERRRPDFAREPGCLCRFGKAGLCRNFYNGIIRKGTALIVEGKSMTQDIGFAIIG
ncbi:MAG: hypothetical protein ACI4OJ_09515, partial [Lachnospiraceae bacterium]